jgi:hypothetical protein
VALLCPNTVAHSLGQNRPTHHVTMVCRLSHASYNLILIELMSQMILWHRGPLSMFPCITVNIGIGLLLSSSGLLPCMHEMPCLQKKIPLGAEFNKVFAVRFTYPTIPAFLGFQACATGLDPAHTSVSQYSHCMLCCHSFFNLPYLLNLSNHVAG